jgi:hypothetical protein
LRTVGVRLSRISLFEGPIEVRLVDLASNYQHDLGSVTDRVLAERLATRKPASGSAASAVRSKLAARAGEASFDEQWPTFTQAIEHWTGERSRSPVRQVSWTCWNVACECAQDVKIGARPGETVSLRCRQCSRTQRVALTEARKSAFGAFAGKLNSASGKK